MKHRPETNEYPSYYAKYIDLLPEQNIIEQLNDQKDEMAEMLEPVTERQSLFQYASLKWNIKEVVGHLTDVERIMAYRLLCIARGEATSLPGHDDQAYVAKASFNEQPLHELIAHFKAVRQSTVLLLHSLPTEALDRKGVMNNEAVTVRALPFIIAGHERHHRQLIKERYVDSVDYPAR
ncbi:DinB family protein [Shouchella shacheensis]|uniref:DinB family protein n=1 Tax=Shouchella shacheensis TaxID=1649580 RepID=UPI00073FF8C3|nr:DinB family protein [Shouchella shacheensis]